MTQQFFVTPPQANIKSYVLGFQEIEKTRLTLVGGKGANLGELSRMDGIRVPPGFCVTTQAFKRILRQAPGLGELLDQLSRLKVEDGERIREISARIRKAIEESAIPKEIEEPITVLLSSLGEHDAYAVRSSATAEDLPTASFAGQQDTYLNVIGKEAILRHIGKCWASLFSERAIIYRIQNGFDHRKVFLSVVVQKMVFPQAAGIMFTADPVTSNRKVVSIDASFGLGEALVSGLVDADIYKARDGRIIEKKISTKKLAIYALKEGGTQQQALAPEQQKTQTLADAQILQLAQTGHSIEAYFGCPQDIEWCLSEGEFYILQSRPITTLYPLPDAPDGKNHVYMSMGHQQMMTDAWKPLGLSFFPILLRMLSSDPVVAAGGRPFMDVSSELTSWISRRIFVNSGLGSVDPLIQKALLYVLQRKNYMKTLYRGKTSPLGLTGGSVVDMFSGLLQARKIERENDPAYIHKLIAKHDALVRKLEQSIQGVSGDALFEFILQDMDLTFKLIVLDNYGVGIAQYTATNWLSKNLQKWLGESGVTDILSQALANNVTTEMGLELLDLADVVRQHPAVIGYFGNASDDTLFEDLAKLEGGSAVSEALQNYLKKYGMRGPGEIDITRTRWAEKPTLLIPMILNNIKNFEPGSHQKIIEQKRSEAENKAQELIGRLEQLPGGKRKARLTRKKISVFRNFIAFREYPKFALMQRFYVYKQALLKEAAGLAQKGLIQEPQDIYYLSFDELRQVVNTGRLDYGIITGRKADYEVFKKLTPPRVMTSDGEIISAEYEADGIPQGALMGVPASAGMVEGRARVVLSLADADFEDGDILVTAFTDPSWTSVFVSIKGLVTEVGGMMTHGAVVAREYGLPAVVSVENAVHLIKDGQKIRVNGSKGYVEILE
jgi:phosphoenolpyruvate synthase/pyruvate phosphate dikinase